MENDSLKKLPINNIVIYVINSKTGEYNLHSLSYAGILHFESNILPSNLYFINNKEILTGLEIPVFPKEKKGYFSGIYRYRNFGDVYSMGFPDGFNDTSYSEFYTEYKNFSKEDREKIANRIFQIIELQQKNYKQFIDSRTNYEKEGKELVDKLIRFRK